MRRRVLAIWLCAPWIFAGTRAAETGDAIAGTWQTNDGDSRVRVEESRGTYAGHVVWLKDAQAPDGGPRLDRLNPDPARRSHPVMGLTVLSGLKYAGHNAWNGGTIYAPASGHSYPCTAALAPDGSLQLKVGAGFAGRTVTWSRVAAPGKPGGT